MQPCHLEGNLKVGAIIGPNRKLLQGIQAFTGFSDRKTPPPLGSKQCVSNFQMPKLGDDCSTLGETLKHPVCTWVCFIVE